MDDIAVKTGPGSAEWEHLVKEKGLEECNRRKAFLGLDADENGNTINDD